MKVKNLAVFQYINNLEYLEHLPFIRGGTIGD